MFVSLGLVFILDRIGKDEYICIDGQMSSIESYLLPALLLSALVIGAAVAISSFFNFLHGPIGSVVIMILGAIFTMIVCATQLSKQYCNARRKINVLKVIINELGIISWTLWVIYNIMHWPWSYNSWQTSELTIAIACDVAIVITGNYMYLGLGQPRYRDQTISVTSTIKLYYYSFGPAYGLGNLPHVINCVTSNGVTVTTLHYVYGLLIPMLFNLLLLVITCVQRDLPTVDAPRN